MQSCSHSNYSQSKKSLPLFAEIEDVETDVVHESDLSIQSNDLTHVNNNKICCSGDSNGVNLVW